MKRLIWAFSLTTCILLTSCFKKRSYPIDIQAVYKNKQVVLDTDFIAISKLKIERNTLKDPNSGEPIDFEFVRMPKLLSAYKQLNEIKDSFLYAEIQSTDGYVLEVPYKALMRSSTLFILETPGKKDRKIDNRILNNKFDWRPGYILIGKGEGATTSPYQIQKIEFFSEPKDQPILTSTPKTLIPGAKVFIKTCLKCHSYLGSGGKKAPAINALLIRHPEDTELKTFLRAPSETLNRKIEMSPFAATEKKLNELVRFLRYIQKQNQL